MVSTSKNETLKSVSVSRNKVGFKKLGSPQVALTGRRLFLKNLILPNIINGFHQQKTIIKTWKPIFKEKRLCSQQKLFFWLVKNSFFSIFQLILAVKTVFRSSGNVFFNRFVIPASGNGFLSSGKNIFLFRALLKLLKFGGDNSCLRKLIFWLAELIFSHFSDTRSSESYFPCNVNAFSFI